jgi:hypothetical protein
MNAKCCRGIGTKDSILCPPKPDATSTRIPEIGQLSNSESKSDEDSIEEGSEGEGDQVISDMMRGSEGEGDQVISDMMRTFPRKWDVGKVAEFLA